MYMYIVCGVCELVCGVIMWSVVPYLGTGITTSRIIFKREEEEEKDPTIFAPIYIFA